MFSLSKVSAEKGLPFEKYAAIPHIVYLCSIVMFHF
jgi:hypothetical protein